MSEEHYHRYTVGSDVRFIGYAQNNPEYTGARATVIDFQSNETGTKYVIIFHNGIIGIVGEDFLEPWLEENIGDILNEIYKHKDDLKNAEIEKILDDSASWDIIKQTTGWDPRND